IATVRRIVRRLRPDILLPAEDPYGVGERLVGRLQLPVWEDYLTAAAVAAKSVDRRVRIGLSASAFDSRDSALYAWAAGPGSPIGRLREATLYVMGAMRALREATVTTPTP